jgi:hypothetical protein
MLFPTVTSSPSSSRSSTPGTGRCIRAGRVEVRPAGGELSVLRLLGLPGSSFLIAASTVVNHGRRGDWHAPGRRAGPGADRRIGGLQSASARVFQVLRLLRAVAYALCARSACPARLPLLDIILPVGISFFTFQAMSYVLDVHRGRSPRPVAARLRALPRLLPAARRRPDRPRQHLLPQIENPAMPRPPRRRPRGDADPGRPVQEDRDRQLPGDPDRRPRLRQARAFGGAGHLAAVYGYAVQIYCDFSAYSDIAIGVALLIGFRFPINFDAPYFSPAIQDFWRRWHISLSTWLRDYLYIPLGGSRGSGTGPRVNLFLTFLLGGLWHGAGWTSSLGRAARRRT